MGMFDASSGDLVTFLKAQTGITALVGSTTSARIYPVYAKQKAALPFIVYVQSGGDSHRHLGGGSGIRRTVLQVYCYGATQSGADALAEQVRLALANHRGRWAAVQFTTASKPWRPLPGTTRRTMPATLPATGRC